VASLNLHCGFGFFGQPFDVAAAVCQLDADVVCVQESWRPIAGDASDPRAGVCGSEFANLGHAERAAPVPGLDAPDPLAEAAAKLGATLSRQVMARLPSLRLPGISAAGGPGELAIAVLTALPVTDYAVIELGVALADGLPRFAQVVTLQLAGGTGVRVVNTHLTHRLTSPIQLRRLQQRLRPAGRQARQLPTLIVGDLNMPRPAAALSLAYAATVHGKTWPATRPLIQLDHVLVDRSMTVMESAILPSAGSDHLPIRARLRVLPSR
jgi:endonuclease/exonuclease/phosphatase family metal-dependent hydrolase